MKKNILTIIFALLICNSASAFSFNDVLLWLPNRIADLTDIFSIGIGSHFGIPKGEVRITRALDFGGGDAAYTVLRKDYNRWLGVSLEQGHNVSVAYFGQENYRVDRVFGIDRWWYPTNDNTNVLRGKIVRYNYKWWENPFSENYDIKTGTRDWFEISAEVGFIGYLRVAIHPIEIADFLLGIFFIDIKDDDLTINDNPDEYLDITPKL